MNAARSVPWVLQSEEKEKYDAWIGSWEAKRTLEEEASLKLTKEMRNTSVKQGHIEKTTRSEEVPIPTDPDPYQIGALRVDALRLREGGGPWTISDVHFASCKARSRR